MIEPDGWNSLGRWLWTASWQAAVLVPLVVLAQRALRRWLTPGWNHALWWVVVIRLCAPALPASAFSVFNLVPNVKIGKAATPLTQLSPDSPTVPVERPIVEGDQREVIPVPDWSGEPVEEVTVANAGSSVGMRGIARRMLWPAWFVGFGIVFALTLRSYGRLRWRIARLPRASDRRLTRLLAEAQAVMGVNRRVLLVEADEAVGPALIGLFHPRLVIPEDLGREFSDGELRHVFLHECAHLRRHDVGLNWLLAFLQAAHWFNPLVWWGFRRMRADRELACDELALRVAGEDNPLAYGETIVRLLERATTAGRLPGVVGIVESKSDIRIRIEMISSFGMRTRRPMLAAVLVMGLGLSLLTQGQSGSPVKVDARSGTEQIPASPDGAPLQMWLPEIVLDGLTLEEAVFVLSDMIKRADPRWPELRFKFKNDRRAGLPGEEDAHGLESTIVNVGQPLFNVTVADALDAMARTADRPICYKLDGNGVVFRAAKQNEVVGGPVKLRERGRALRAKLDEIAIPEVLYDGLTLNEVVMDLSEQTKRYDPRRVGVNFLLVDGPRERVGSPPAQGLMPISDPVFLDSTLSRVLIRQRTPLKDGSVATVLDAVVGAAERPIRWFVTDYAVVIEPMPGGQGGGGSNEGVERPASVDRFGHGHHRRGTGVRMRRADAAVAAGWGKHRG